MFWKYEGKGIRGFRGKRNWVRISEIGGNNFWRRLSVSNFKLVHRSRGVEGFPS